MKKIEWMNEDIVAWKNLLPGWEPSREEFNKLFRGSPEYTQALMNISRGWDQCDSRWDVLLALFEYNRRTERKIKWARKSGREGSPS